MPSTIEPGHEVSHLPFLFSLTDLIHLKLQLPHNFELLMFMHLPSVTAVRPVPKPSAKATDTPLQKIFQALIVWFMLM